MKCLSCSAPVTIDMNYCERCGTVVPKSPGQDWTSHLKKTKKEEDVAKINRNRKEADDKKVRVIRMREKMLKVRVHKAIDKMNELQEALDIAAKQNTLFEEEHKRKQRFLDIEIERIHRIEAEAKAKAEKHYRVHSMSNFDVGTIVLPKKTPDYDKVYEMLYNRKRTQEKRSAVYLNGLAMPPKRKKVRTNKIVPYKPKPMTLKHKYNNRKVKTPRGMIKPFMEWDSDSMLGGCCILIIVFGIINALFSG